MNTNLIASFFFALATSTLAAQDLKLEADASPRGLTASVRGAEAGSMVILVMGMHETALRLPDGQILGVQPDMLMFAAVDDAGSPANFRVPALAQLDEYVVFVQAAALHSRRAIDQFGGIALSPVSRVESSTTSHPYPGTSGEAQPPIR